MPTSPLRRRPDYVYSDDASTRENARLVLDAGTRRVFGHLAGCMMDYGLAVLAIGSPGVVLISEGDYFDLDAAKTGLLNALFSEEKFDLVVENYLELETELLSSTARYAMHGETDERWFQVERNLINRRLINLLSVCRGYLDFARPLGRNLLANEPDEAAQFEASFGKHYDGTFGYRAMEALRNYVQHRGFPIHALSYSGKLDETQPRNRFSYGVSVFVKATYLAEAGDFKASVLAEIQAMGGRLNVKPLFRDYVACLSEIHSELRKIQRSVVSRWESKFADLTAKYRAVFPSASLQGLVAAKIDGPKRTDEIYLHPAFIERRRELESKNRGYGNLAKRYVTGSVLDDDA